jgi:hypothetical protein
MMESNRSTTGAGEAGGCRGTGGGRGVRLCGWSFAGSIGLGALVSQRRAPLEARLAAGVLVGRTRLARWTRRAGIAVFAAVMTVVVLVAVPAVAALVHLLHAM